MPGRVVSSLFARISPATVRTFVLAILVLSAVAIWLYMQAIFAEVREFQDAVVDTQVNIYLSIIDPRSGTSDLDSHLFDSVVRDAPYPSVFTDENLQPIQGLWHNIGIAPDDTTAESRRKIRDLVRKMDRVNQPKKVLMPGLRTSVDTLVVYELPFSDSVPVIITDETETVLDFRNLPFDASDTTAVKNTAARLDVFSQPLVFDKPGEPRLVFHHGYMPPGAEWPIVIMKNDAPLYWHDIGIAQGDSSAAALSRAAERASDIAGTGLTYRLVTTITETINRVHLFHYGDLPFLQLIGWLPVLEFIVLLIMLAIGLIGYMNIKNAEQRSIWVGMAKETAHQLGTPISSLQGWLELMRTENDPELMDAAIEDMEIDVDRLGRVAARFSSIGSRPELKPTDVSDVIEEVLKYFRSRVPRMGRTVVLSSEFHSLRRVMGHPDLLNWAFENLVKNAIAAIESKDGRITVTGSMSKNLNEVIIDVADNGKGIPPGNQKKIMQPGFTTKTRGWGLGLNLVKRIIEDYHGGSMYLLESTPGTGSVFRVVLPAVTKGEEDE